MTINAIALVLGIIVGWCLRGNAERGIRARVVDDVEADIGMEALQPIGNGE